MQHWLMENKEWVILGVGIVVVTTLIGTLARIWARHRSGGPESVPAAPLPPPLPPRPTPSSLQRPDFALALPPQPRSDLAVLLLQGQRPKLRDMLSEIHRVPASQRPFLVESFFGFPVTCEGQTKAVSALPSGRMRIDLMADADEVVFFEVDPAAYPALDLTKIGARLVAHGRFRSTPSGVWLDDVELAV